MTPFLLAAPLLAARVNHLWHAVPLVVVISLVYSATRHEDTGPILTGALRVAVMLGGFMAFVLGVMLWLTRGL
jgi:hypothetical protein